MDKYTIKETFELPSKGSIYSTTVAPRVTLRSMTTQDEMTRLSPSENSFEPMCKLIDDCMIEFPGISSYDMCLGDYQFLLYRLRAITYGEEYTMGSVCPYCKSQHVEKVNLSELAPINLEEDIKKYQRFELPVTKKTIEINFQTPRMLDSIQAREKEFRRKHKEVTQDYTLVFTLEELINTIDGRKVDPITLEEWIKQLPMKDTNIIIQSASKLNEAVGMNTTVEQVCDVCGLNFNTKVRADAEFFRPALH